MALSSLRLRRALSLSPSLLHHNLQLNSSKQISTLLLNPSPKFNLDAQKSKNPFVSHLQWFRFFRSSPVSLSTRRQFQGQQDDQEIGPDTILFEGCDYNHFLITYDFGKENKLSAEEMVETYVQTAAKVFGSVEEAKKRIYACSTTTYHGFQVECSEETSEKFKDIEGVVFILPDSYIDPVNKEYGGDKYINGTIIPRPPPIQYRNDRRPRNQRTDERRPMQGETRNFDRPQYDSPQGPPSQQNYGPPQGPHDPRQNYGPPQGQNYGPPQGPLQNYGPPQGSTSQQNHAPPQGPPSQHNNAPPQGLPSQHNNAPPQGPPSHHNNAPPQGLPSQHNNAPPQGLPSQHNFAPPQGLPSQHNFAPPQGLPSQHNFAPPQGPPSHHNYAPPQRPPSQQHYGPPSQQNYGPPRQGPSSQLNYTPPRQGPSSQQNYAPPLKGPISQQNYAPLPQAPLSQQNYRPTPQGPPHQQNYELHSSLPPQPNSEYPLRHQKYSMQQAPLLHQNYAQTQDLPHQQSIGRHQNYAPEQKYGQQDSPAAQKNYGLAQNVSSTASGGWDQHHGYQGEKRFEGQGHGQNQSYMPTQGGNFNPGLGGTTRQELGSPYNENYASHGNAARFSQSEPKNDIDVGGRVAGQGKY